MLKINNLFKYYNTNKSNEIKAVDGVTLELEGKGLVVLLGKSGCGKSTLLNVLGGLDVFNSGEVTIDDKTFSKYNAKELDELRNRKIGYVFQNYNLIPDITVSENLKISLDLAGIVDNQKERIEYALDLVGLAKYQNRYPQNLSGGQQQRVGIARAIVKNPEILIADEPTGNLDDTNTVAVMRILKGLSKHCLVIMVTHEENLADYYADRIIRLADGKVVSDEINESNATLDHRSKDVIYLGDLERNDVTLGGLNMEFFGEHNAKANIKIVSYDNKLYIKIDTDKVVNIVDEDSSIKLTEEKYTVKEKNEDEAELDLDKLTATERKKTHAIDYKRTCKNVLNDFLATRGQRRKNRFRTMFLCSLIFVLLVAANAGSLVYNEFAYKPHDSNVICINAKESDVAKMGLDGRVVNKGVNVSVTISAGASPFESQASLGNASNVGVLPASIFGIALDEGEVKVDKLLYDRGIKNTSLSDVGIVLPEQLIGMRLDIDNKIYGSVYYYPEGNEEDYYNKPTAYTETVVTDEPLYLTIVGLENRNEPLVYVSDADYERLYTLENYVYKDANTFFYANNPRKTIKELEDKGIKATSYATYVKKIFYKTSIATHVISLLVIVLLLVVQLIGVYKLTKSRFIAAQKKFAIMRTIGVPKNQLVLNAFFESLYIFSLSSFRGWLFSSVVVIAADNMSVINTLENLIGTQIIYYPVWLALASLAVMAVFSVLVALLTPLTYLTRTPAKLISNYDV
ncbi:MAG: ABC transporter ATP-binding protein/permease [Clostridia bacterium]|nr:ABC transporter ATP-binding protein/permease [Clostridia bacterium]